MKESISYSFLLNIVIIFIFTCFAILMGILSYYRAFKANTIISETIEKYEGYNCLSAEEISRKINGIGYNTPFNVNCNGKGDRCMTDADQNYAIVSYNLDDGFSNADLIFKNSGDQYETMNSTYKCDGNGCITNKNYQYGVYTYMYVELPVVSNLIRIPFFSKTSVMYEFRNIYAESNNGKTVYTDVETVYPKIYSKNKLSKNTVSVKYANPGTTVDLLWNAGWRTYVKAAGTGSSFADLSKYMVKIATGEEKDDLKTRALTYHMTEQGNFSNYMRFTSSRQMHECGYITDYSKIK